MAINIFRSYSFNHIELSCCVCAFLSMIAQKLPHLYDLLGRGVFVLGKELARLVADQLNPTLGAGMRNG